MDPSGYSLEEMKQDLIRIFADAGLDDYRWIEPRQILVRQWVRMKCLYGCAAYGHKAACPPNTPEVEECRSFFQEYGLAAVFHLTGRMDQEHPLPKSAVRRNKSLVELERKVFLAGYHRAFMLVTDPCYMCKDCGGSRDKCNFPKQTRPSPEAMAVDVYETVRRLGFQVEVLTDPGQKMDRYGFLMID